MARTTLYMNVDEISAFHNTVALFDIEGWRLKVNISHLTNKFNLSHLLSANIDSSKHVDYIK